MLALPEIGDGEPQPKQRKRSQLKQKLVGGVVVCRYCGDPLSGRMVFCQHKNPRCTQAFHRREAEQAQAAKAADDRRAAFQEGMQHQAASMELHAGQLLLTEKSSTELESFQRTASSGWDDIDFCIRFNNLYLEREVDGWQKSTRTLPITLKLEHFGPLFEPFLFVARLSRTSDEMAHVLLPNGQRWSTTVSTTRKKIIYLSGYYM